jgi:hypothetical protein
LSNENKAISLKEKNLLGITLYIDEKLHPSYFEEDDITDMFRDEEDESGLGTPIVSNNRKIEKVMRGRKGSVFSKNFVQENFNLDEEVKASLTKRSLILHNKFEEGKRRSEEDKPTGVEKSFDCDVLAATRPKTAFQFDYLKESNSLRPSVMSSFLENENLEFSQYQNSHKNGLKNFNDFSKNTFNKHPFMSKSKKMDRRILRRSVNQKEAKTDSQGSTVIKRIRLNEIERFIHKKINPKEHKLTARTGYALLTVIILFNWIAIYAKNPIHRIVIKDIESHAIPVDVFSWQIWSLVYPILYMDFCRATREGWIDNQVTQNFRNETMFTYCHSQLGRTSAFNLAPDDTIDIAVRDMTLDLFDLEGWTSTMVELHFAKFPDDSQNSEFVEFYQETWPRRAAVKYIQTFAGKINGRNYENGTDIIEFEGDPANRLKDADEENYRRLALGDFHKQYSLRSYDYYDYFKKLGRYEQYFILYSTLITTGLGLLTTAVFFIYLCCQAHKMNKFYTIIFQIKVKNLLIISLTMSKSKMKFSRKRPSN